MTGPDAVPPTQLPAGFASGPASDGPAEWQPGDVILDLYEVVSLLGEGGMGKVHKVRHRGWNTDLAVKSPKPGVFAGPGGREAFVREAETWVELGLHPHLVSCHYVRSLGGVPRVFAELVDGGSLADWIGSGRLYEGGPEDALARILDVAIQFAWGLAYAHEKGLVHQDVKPANLMMTAAGEAKVTDFGLARARMFAGVGVAPAPGTSGLVSIGGMTRAYCSPEQARGEPVSPATDVWSWALSVLEMFTGEVTWAMGPAGAAALAAGVESDERPARCPKMPRRVAELLGRCLRGSPTERPRMDGVSEALSAVHQEVTGRLPERPAPKPATLQADGLNNRGLSYVDLGRVSDAQKCWQAALAHDALHPEALYNSLVCRWRQAEFDDVELLQSLSVLARGSALSSRGALVTALVHIERGDREAAEALLEPLGAAGGEEVRAALRQAATEEMGRGQPVRVFEGHKGQVTAACLSADGRIAVTGGEDSMVCTWDLETGLGLRSFEGHASRVTSLALAADGRRVISGSGDATVRLWDLSPPPWRWRRRLSDPAPAWSHGVRVLAGHESDVTSLSLSPDARWALSGSKDGSVRLWDLESARCAGTLKHEPVVAVWLSADGRRGASAGRTSIRTWDLTTGAATRSIELPLQRTKYPMIALSWVQFSADGRHAVWSDMELNPRMLVWSLDTGEVVRVLPPHAGQAQRGVFSRSGRRILMDHMGRLRLWEMDSGRCTLTLQARSADNKPIYGYSCLSVGSDGRTLLAGSGKTLRLWALPAERPSASSLQPSRPSSHAVLSDVAMQARRLREGARSALAAGRTSDALRQLTEARALPGQERTVESMSAWEELSQVCRRRRVHRWWRAATLRLPSTAAVTAACLARDGRWAMTGSKDGSLHLWDTLAETCRPLAGHKEEIRSLSASHDGRWLLSASRDGMRLWERETGECRRVLGPVVNPRVYGGLGVSLSPDGAWAASTASDLVRIWDLSSGRCVRLLPKTCPDKVAWTTDGRRLVTAYHCLNSGGNRWLKVWDVATGTCLRTIKKYFAPFCLSSNGRFVAAPRRHWGTRYYPTASGTRDRGRPYSIALLDLDDGREVRSVSSPIELERRAITLSEDSGWLMTASLLFDWGDPEHGTAISTTGALCEAWLSADATWTLAVDTFEPAKGTPRTLSLWQLDWELEPVEPADWDEAARPYLEAFLTVHTPYALTLPAERDPTPDEVTLALTRRGKPAWTEPDFERLRFDLGCAGLGWLRPEGVRRKLAEMAAAAIP